MTLTELNEKTLTKDQHQKQKSNAIDKIQMAKTDTGIVLNQVFNSEDNFYRPIKVEGISAAENKKIFNKDSYIAFLRSGKGKSLTLDFDETKNPGQQKKLTDLVAKLTNSTVIGYKLPGNQNAKDAKVVIVVDVNGSKGWKKFN